MNKRVLIVNDLLTGGGVEKLMYDLVWALHDRYDITILTDNKADDFYQIYPENVGYFYRNIEKGPWHRWDYIGRLLGKIKRKCFYHNLNKKLDPQNYDVAIAMKDGWKILEVSQMKIPVKYAWVHTDYNSYYYTWDMFKGIEGEREAFKQFQKIVCVSEDIKTGLIDVIGDTGNYCVLYNPINGKEILEKAEEAVVDVDTEKTPGVVRFVTVGRLNYQKGYDLLLEACNMLNKDGLKYEVWLVGGKEDWGDEHNRLFRTQKRLGLDNVKFIGGRKNPYKYMKHADWFLSSSIFEGFSLVSQEAAILDIPLALTDCSGVRELLGDSEYGLVMEKSVLGIYQGMKKIIEHPELQEHYKKQIMLRKQTINFDQRLQEIVNMIEEE